KNKFPELITYDSHFTFLPTYDIDEAFSYKNKTIWRTGGGLMKDALNGQWSKIVERIQVMRGKKKDPYDSFDWMDKLHHQFNLKALYFFLMAPKNFKYDKNILPSEKAMQELIKKHGSYYTIGIHPSWQCGDHLSLINSEVKSLENIIGNKVTISRRHYLKFTLPRTFRVMIEAGITEEHSMGYASVNGFRASVASPFYWYDLEKEETTGLLLYPFCLMDANSLYEQKFTAEQALEEMRQYYNVIKSVDGLMITLWHNNFFGTEKLFAGWKEAYEQFIKEIS
ncbi:MAG: polysaccharide deacetylase family protein, partial [Bacteroidia bacterium]|nr:polysaccharide deacetylase family protein [Bacteroidia bacterium]